MQSGRLVPNAGGGWIAIGAEKIWILEPEAGCACLKLEFDERKGDLRGSVKFPARCNLFPRRLPRSLLSTSINASRVYFSLIS
jgi:hypothetical protein